MKAIICWNDTVQGRWSSQIEQQVVRFLLTGKLFTRSDAVEASWRFFDPVLRYWKEHTDTPLYGYPEGTWGPLESEAMMHEHGAEWTNPCKNLTNTDEYCEL